MRASGCGITREHAGHAEVWRGNSKTSRERHRERNGAARRLFPALPRRAIFMPRLMALASCPDLTCALCRNANQPVCFTICKTNCVVSGAAIYKDLRRERNRDASNPRLGK